MLTTEVVYDVDLPERFTEKAIRRVTSVTLDRRTRRVTVLLGGSARHHIGVLGASETRTPKTYDIRAIGGWNLGTVAWNRERGGNLLEEHSSDSQSRIRRLVA